MAEITAFGFERDDLSTLIENYKEQFRTAFGQEILLDDDSTFGQLASLLAERDNENQKLAEAVYQSKTLSGAEGVYLDDIYSRFGIFRLDKQEGSGEAVIKTDSTLASGYTLPDTIEFSAENGITYTPVIDTLLRDVVYGIEIPKSAVVATTYTLQIFNKATSTVETLVHTVPTTGDGDVLAFFAALETFVKDNIDTPAATVYTDVTAVKFYAGFSQSDNTFIGMGDNTTYTCSPKAGNLYHLVNVVAGTPGVFPLPAGGINNLSPTFTGFVQADNIRPFDEGEDVESDTAYRLRAQQVISGLTVGTKEGVIKALLDVTGVDSVVIYDNPTLTDTAEATALTFNTVISGGSTDALLAQAIYDNKPVNVGTSGTLSESIVASDGNSEVISFTRAVDKPVDLRFTYISVNNIPLSVSEQDGIKTSLVEFFDNLRIGDDVYNSQLLSSFLSAINTGRVIDVTAEIKDEGGGSYSTAPFVTAFNEIATIKDTQIFFVQTVI